MRKPAPHPCKLQGSWVQCKPLPNNPALPHRATGPALPQDKSQHRGPQTSSNPGTDSVASQRQVPVAGTRQVSSEQSWLFSLQILSVGAWCWNLVSPDADALKRGYRFPRKLQPRASSRPRASSASTPWKGRALQPLIRQRSCPKGLRLGQPKCPPDMGMFAASLTANCSETMQALWGSEGIQRHPYNKDNTSCSYPCPQNNI